jgi:hypothetical protein
VPTFLWELIKGKKKLSADGESRKNRWWKTVVKKSQERIEHESVIESYENPGLIDHIGYQTVLRRSKEFGFS